MTKIEISDVKKGNNEIINEFNKLNSFVKENFDLLYEGAVRIGKRIPEDYFAPRRVQINKTRLHESNGIKIADNWHSLKDEEFDFTEEKLLNTVRDIKILLEEAKKDIQCSFKIIVEKNS